MKPKQMSSTDPVCQLWAWGAGPVLPGAICWPPSDAEACLWSLAGRSVTLSAAITYSCLIIPIPLSERAVACSLQLHLSEWILDALKAPPPFTFHLRDAVFLTLFFSGYFNSFCCFFPAMCIFTSLPGHKT